MTRQYELHVNNKLVYVGFKPEISKMIADTLTNYERYGSAEVNFKVKMKPRVAGIKEGKQHFYDYEETKEGRFEGWE